MLLEELVWKDGWAWEVFPRVHIARGTYDDINGEEYYHIFDNNPSTGTDEWYVTEALTAQAILFHLAEKYGNSTSNKEVHDGH
jgi:hypothetical protein